MIYTWKNTCTCTHACAYIHTRIHTYVHRYIHTRMHTHTRIAIGTYMFKWHYARESCHSTYVLQCVAMCCSVVHHLESVWDLTHKRNLMRTYIVIWHDSSKSCHGTYASLARIVEPSPRAAACCIVLRCVAVCCIPKNRLELLQRVTACCSMLRRVAVFYNVLQCAALLGIA